MIRHQSTTKMSSDSSVKLFWLIGHGRSLLFLLFCLGITCALASEVDSETTPKAESEGPVQVDQIVPETDFNTIRLTQEAEQRLGIQTVAIERQAVSQTRRYGGELILPLHQGSPGGEQFPSKETQSVFTILPLMTPADQIRVAEAQVTADGQVQAAKVQVQAARVLLARAERLLRDHAGSQRAVQEAKIQFQLAQAALAEARARRQLLGPPLLSMTMPDQFWIRVPVYVGALNEIDRQQPARMEPLGNMNRQKGFMANPVSGPPSSNPIAATIDLFYEVANSNQEWQLGQKVQVLVPLKHNKESLTVPWSAVVFDIYGGTWVYKQTSPHTFVRARVQVSFLSGSTAVLASGPTPGTKIVTQGVAELLGIEVGFSQ